MKEITVLSGKGGAGKTSVTAALASLFCNAVFCDNDVDASDLHLIFSPQKSQVNEFIHGWNMLVDPLICDGCGICENLCRFDAISVNIFGKAEVNNIKCEGCRLCERSCPSNALMPTPNRENCWYLSSTRFGPFISAEMGVAEDNSGKLVSYIRNKAEIYAKESNADYIINDGPPGIGCPTIASITGTDVVLVVIEPTVSGWHDALRVLDLVRKWGIKVYAVINKGGLNISLQDEISVKLLEIGVPLLSIIPWSKDFVEAMKLGQNVMEYSHDTMLKRSIEIIYQELKLE
ncbi:ATP-binding protein [Halosquirtibacter laminarini]|uniref:ATP-binding protein n=1 Tax=Halosquirtibacter laminarini TaxID=3374600 RepID=A0AC61NIY0_9BACT|nr:ATP-binding protein [Prolixibacteraceae bacterium]